MSRLDTREKWLKNVNQTNKVFVVTLRLEHLYRSISMSFAVTQAFNHSKFIWIEYNDKMSTK